MSALIRALGWALFGFSALSLPWPAWSNPPAPRYRIVDLGTLGGEDSAAEAVNDRGDVVGWADTVEGRHHAFLYSGGVIRDLGTLLGGEESYATSINDRGQVAGYSDINAFGPQFPEIVEGFVWDENGMRSLAALFCPCSFNTRYGRSNAYALNNEGWVAGESETVRGSWVVHAALWRDTAPEDWGGGAGDWSISRIFSLNDAGTAVGDYAPYAGRLNSYNRSASLWDNGTRHDLGVLPGDASSTASAVNNRGAAAGWSGSADGATSHAFLWTGAALEPLGALRHGANSSALAINAMGEVVGWSVAPGGSIHAFLWRAGRMWDLNQTIPEYSGWQLLEATGIDLYGDIVGNGVHNGHNRAFLLTVEDAYGGRD